MNRAKTISAARVILAKIGRPSNRCDVKTYTAHVQKVIAGEQISIREIGTLLTYYECHAEEVVGRIVKDLLGKG